VTTGLVLLLAPWAMPPYLIVYALGAAIIFRSTWQATPIDDAQSGPIRNRAAQRWPRLARPLPRWVLPAIVCIPLGVAIAIGLRELHGMEHYFAVAALGALAVGAALAWANEL
jgi:hypothetical protein